MDCLTFITKLTEHSAWPISIIVVTLILRKPISNILEKLKKANIQGNEFEFGNQVVQKTSKLDETPISIPIPTDTVGMQKEYEQLIKRDLRTANVQTPEEKENILISHLAATQLNAAYEKISSTIFGSQIELLQSINSANKPASLNSLKLFYDHSAQKYPEFYKSYDQKSYINYLLHMKLIKENENGYLITTFGIGFLVYITEKGLTGHRSY